MSVGNAVQILCSDRCENETYIKLDRLLNSKFIIEDAALTWWETEAIKSEIVAMNTVKRKENFIAYLTSEAKRLGSDNIDTKDKIKKYADSMDYSFADLLRGGRKFRKSKKKFRKSKKEFRKSKKKFRKSKKRYL